MPYFEVFSWRYWGRTRYLVVRIASLLAEIWTWDPLSTSNTKQKCHPPEGGRCTSIRYVCAVRIPHYEFLPPQVHKNIHVSSSDVTAAILMTLMLRSTSCTMSTAVYTSGGKSGQNASQTAVPPHLLVERLTRYATLPPSPNIRLHNAILSHGNK